MSCHQAPSQDTGVPTADPLPGLYHGDRILSALALWRRDGAGGLEDWRVDFALRGLRWGNPARQTVESKIV